MPEEKDKIILEVDDIQFEEEAIKKKAIRVLSFCLSEENYCVDIRSAKEVAKINKITRVPNTPEFISGVINLRGEVVSLCDIRYFLGLSSGGKSKEIRGIITDVTGSNIGFIVDKIRGAMDIDVDLIQPPLATLSQKLALYTKGQVQIEGEIFIILDLERILNCEEVVRLAKGEGI
ncbi:MAG: chemotaxis protein CheW [Candidatus Omnitrophica bacterium]|nr:chemotaxis protein CheW [Candidatus Omnitrophota bacterium]